MEFGEHPRDATVREVREETGCEVAIGALLGVHSGLFEAGGGSQQHVVRLLFEGDVLGEPRVSQPEEVNAVAWHPPLDSPPEHHGLGCARCRTAALTEARSTRPFMARRRREIAVRVGTPQPDTSAAIEHHPACARRAP